MPTVQLRLPSGELLCSKHFPAETSLSEVEAADFEESFDCKFFELHIITAIADGKDMILEEPSEWEVCQGFDVDAGNNAAEMAAASVEDLEACRKKCVAEGFGAFVVFKGTAYFRRAKASQLGPRVTSLADATLHLYHTSHEVALRKTLASFVEPGFATTLELGVLLTTRRVEMTLPEIAKLEKPVQAVHDVCVTVGSQDKSLECLVDTFPSLTKLEIVIPPNTKADAASTFWDPLQRLVYLEHLHLANHHSFTHKGCFHDEVFRSLLSWGERKNKLKRFSMTGAMLLNRAVYKTFVDTNQVLSPDLEQFSVFHWFANPPQVDDETVHKITRRYQHLKILEVGSCCHSTTDRAFKYFADNGEGVRAGLELEKLFLVCTTQVSGTDWLEPPSVKRNLPKLKEFKIGGGRIFCSCCGSRAHVLKQLRDECGVAVQHTAPHW